METITQSISAFSIRTTIAMVVNLLLTVALLGGLVYLFLLALAKLYGISAETLLKGVQS